MKIMRFSAAACLLIIAGCQSGTGVDRMARELCDCMRPMAEAFNQMQNADAQAPEALRQASRSLEEASAEADACFEKLEEAHGAALVEEEAEIRRLVEQYCPEVARAMKEAESAPE